VSVSVSVFVSMCVCGVRDCVGERESRWVMWERESMCICVCACMQK